MTTLAQLRTEIDRKVDDSGVYTTAVIDLFIDQALIETAGVVDIPALKTSGTITSDTSNPYASMPADFCHRLFHLYNETRDERIKVFANRDMLLAQYAFDFDKAGTIYAAAVEHTESGTSAVGTITLTDLPIAEETVVVDSTTFTFKDARGAANEITIGANVDACVANIATAINTDLSTVTATASTDDDTVTLTAVAVGRDGNFLTFSESASNLTVDGSGYLGGTTSGNVQGARLYYARTPSSANTLTGHYFKRPTPLRKATDVPSVFPAHLQRPLLVNHACWKIFEEIYGEDPEGQAIISRYEKGYYEAVSKLLAFYPPQQEPVQVFEAVAWSSL